MSGAVRWTDEQLEAYQRRTRNFGVLTCEVCAAVVQKVGPGQRYCEPCSAERDRERKKMWARDNPQERTTEDYDRRRGAMLVRGTSISEEATGGIASFRQPDLCWLVRVGVPFSYAASKNHIYSMRAAGHVALRREGKALREKLAGRIRLAMDGRKPKQNKLWIDIHVQKSNHKGDAVNVVDLVCDAVKDAIPLDDRWYCLRGVDWEIAKGEGQIYVGVGQEEVEDVQACSSCGRLLPFAMFGRNRANKTGLARNCLDCGRVE